MSWRMTPSMTVSAAYKTAFIRDKTADSSFMSFKYSILVRFDVEM
jgi:hypothetical protein